MSESQSSRSRSRYAALIDALLHGNGGVGKCNCETCSARREAAEAIRDLSEQIRLTPSETASRNAAPQEGAGSPAGPAANGELAVAAFINDLPIPEEFHALASFYDVKDLSSLVRMQQEHIEGLQAKLPPTPTFPGPQRVREG
jgi:hypothetical protein